jgi:hypothetical protein
MVDSPQRAGISSRLRLADAPRRSIRAGHRMRKRTAGGILRVQLKQRQHAGLNHGKLVLLYGQGMSIYGSSNWTSASAESQQEHNIFSTDPTAFGLFRQRFLRKWNNSTSLVENVPFTRRLELRHVDGNGCRLSRKRTAAPLIPRVPGGRAASRARPRPLP